MLIQILLFGFPWKIRRFFLRIIYGYKIDPTARIGFSIILAKELKMNANSRIHSGVLCKRIDLLEVGCDAGIASWTLITGYSSGNNGMYSHIEGRRCELILGKSSGITSRHYVDCTAGVYIGEFTTIAGIRSQILTHSINIYENRQDATPIYIGRYCFIGTGCILLPGCSLPDYSILGAGSVLNKRYEKPGMLYAGVPAAAKKELTISDIPYFHREKHFVD